MSEKKILWKLVTFRLRLYLVMLFAVILAYTVAPNILAATLQRFFDCLESDVGKAYAMCIFLIILGILNRALLVWKNYLDYPIRESFNTLLRQNIFQAILGSKSIEQYHDQKAKILVVFKEDVECISQFLISLSVVVAWTFFSVYALATMLKISVVLTIFLCIPLIIIMFAVKRGAVRIKKYREDDRGALEKVNGFILKIFSNIEMIQLERVQNEIVKQYVQLNEKRFQTNMKEKKYRLILDSFTDNIVNIGTAIILIIMSVYARNITLGQISLFVFYIGYMGMIFNIYGNTMAEYAQVQVSLRRVAEILENGDLSPLVKHQDIYIVKEVPNNTGSVKRAEEPFERLKVEGLTYKYDNVGRGIEDISFGLEKGQLLVVTGRIGSGKTTLLKCIQGLLEKTNGSIEWNGKQIENLYEFFVPPHSAYTPQVPRLYSETIEENIKMGLSVSEDELKTAIYQAVLEDDIEQLENGLNTMVSADGQTLSGGQMQRTVAARMFLREAEIMIMDDLGSALDVETERKLLKRMKESGKTGILVSSRRLAFEMADKILILKNGKIAGEGTLTDLMEHNDEMKLLWNGVGKDV